MAGKRKFSSRSVVAVVGIFLSLLVVLGGFRFYSFSLESLLSEINRKIEAHSLEEMELWQAFSSLTSPIKVYSYCKDMLGMDSPQKVEVVRVQRPRVAVVPAPSPKGWRSGVLSFFGLSPN
jgi:hypothetical protein